MQLQSLGRSESVKFGGNEGARFLGFVIAAGSSVPFNLGSRILFSTIFSFEIAVMLSQVVGMLVAYSLVRTFVFESSQRPASVEFARFSVVNLVSLAQVWVVSTGLLRVVYPLMDWTIYPEFMAHAVGLSVSAVTSFVGHRYFSFAQSVGLSAGEPRRNPTGALQPRYGSAQPAARTDARAVTPTARRTDPAEVRPPLVVDLDGTLARTDTLDEAFAAAFFRNPLLTLLTVARALPGGRARLKQVLGRLAPIDAETLPLRDSLLSYLQQQKRGGRELHLATAADRAVAEAVAARVGLFGRVFASDGVRNLKGRIKAEVLAEAFPRGFSYAGDSRADLAVWRRAESAVVVAPPAVARGVARLTEVEQTICDPPVGLRAWLKAARPHQWSKNLLVLVPMLLGWWQITPEGLARTCATLALMCVMSSLTYMINDVADVQSDRRHARKRSRGFASGALKLRDGLIVGGVGLPAVLLAAWFLVGPETAACLLFYAVLTLAYSMGLKRIPLADCMIIGVLFTVRIAAGTTAGGLAWSPWLLSFSVFFFFSLAMVKRLAELVAGGSDATGSVRGRGFRYEERPTVLAFGVAASTISILIILLYLMEEVFPRDVYGNPLALWVAPVLIFLWLGRVWTLATRGEMHHDPVVFALRDQVSYFLGALMGVAFLAALL
ncbi:UbiA family prenyltransferase [Phenylobacterium sp. LjRoot219]|uniref:UbiA family prenyltransferase n=1 Tax=Phenylobacterium sp. LjRoot219 TaxID=3342283 RepID=UPI003ECE9640